MTARRLTAPAAALSATLCALAAAAAGATAVECPASLPVAESVAPTALEGWTVFDTRQGPAYPFFGVSVSDGPPQNRVFLTPSKSVRLKTRKEDVYDFKAAGIVEAWILCQYRDTSVGVAKKLEPGFARCRVIYDAKTDFRSVKSIECD